MDSIEYKKEDRIGKRIQIRGIAWGEGSFNNECDVINYLKLNWDRIFPGKFLVGFDVPIYGCFSNNRIGLVDIMFTKGKRKFFVEAKFDKGNTSGDFWDSLKVLGYVQAYKLYHPNEEITPVIMINREILSYEKRAILSKLGVYFMAFTISDNYIQFSDNLAPKCQA